MKTYVIDSYVKSVDDLPSKYREDAPEPKPDKNDVLVDVYSAGLNFFDILQVQGKYQIQPPFPWYPGCEFAGRISATSPIPKGCNFVPGKTRVFGGAQGAFAERMKADWRQLLPIPDGMSYEQASTIYITYPTSYLALAFRAQLQKDEWCLVHAAAGGVGLCAVQIAKALGAKVIATAGTAEKLEVAKKHGGADYVLDYTKDGWQKKVLEITGGHGADVIYDPVGLIQPSMKCIAWNGRALVIGFAAGTIEKIPTNLALLKHASIVGVFWGGFTKKEAERIPEVWKAILGLIQEGKLKPVIYEELYKGLESLPKGLKDLGGRKTWGKAVLQIRKDDRDAKL